VNNAFDRGPPLVSMVGPSFGSGNAFPQVYNSLGRKSSST
jgi:hypothetical protein